MPVLQTRNIVFCVSQRESRKGEMELLVFVLGLLVPSVIGRATNRRLGDQYHQHNHQPYPSTPSPYHHYHPAAVDPNEIFEKGLKNIVDVDSLGAMYGFRDAEDVNPLSVDGDSENNGNQDISEDVDSDDDNGDDQELDDAARLRGDHCSMMKIFAQALNYNNTHACEEFPLGNQGEVILNFAMSHNRFVENRFRQKTFLF